MCWLTYSLLAATAIAFIYHYVASSWLTAPLPPGPQGKLWAGNAHQMKAPNIWRKYAEWSQEFGPLVQLRAYSRKFIVLNSFEAANDLLEKRAAIYSDRPMSWMLFDLCGRGLSPFNISSLHPWHKAYRKVIPLGLNSSVIQSFWPLMQSEAQIMVKGLLAEPDKLVTHVRRNAAAVIMMVSYGYPVMSEEDEFIAAAEETSKITGRAMAPGQWLVESFPLLRFVPSWLPGAAFKRRAITWKKRFDYLSSIPHQWVMNQISSGKFVESFTSRLMLKDDGSYPDTETEEIIRWAAGGLYAGAADTTVSALISFVMLMALHPEIQRQAQAEIDEAIGRCATPTVDDCDRLIYLAAILKEVLRFAPVGPLALPHRATKDDEYIGLRIPKDTTIIANVWQILHDGRIYPNPFAFNPGRFFRSHSASEGPYIQPDPRKYAFGFGARSCPGQRFAEKSLLLSMCCILSHCMISSAADVNIDGLEYTDGITSHIKPFKCSIEPR